MFHKYDEEQTDTILEMLRDISLELEILGCEVFLEVIGEISID